MCGTGEEWPEDLGILGKPRAYRFSQMQSRTSDGEIMNVNSLRSTGGQE